MKKEKYTIGGQLGENERFRLYECTLPDNTTGIFKIASTVEQNGPLDREAYILDRLRREAEICEQLYAKENPGSGKILNYQICFPNLVETFTAKDQDNRRVIIMNFTHVPKDLKSIVPLGKYASHAFLRIDPRTSAWILGKLLKLLVFTHSLNISIGQVTSDNILIVPEKHFVTIFDWSLASTSSKISSDIMREEIAKAATEVMLALGGNPENGYLPPSDQLVGNKYATRLYQLANGYEDNAREAHKNFYRLIRSLWPREFWPFTTYPLERK